MSRHPAVPILLAFCLAELLMLLVYRGRAARAEAALGPADSATVAWHATADSAIAVAREHQERSEKAYQLFERAQEWADSTVTDAYAELAAVRTRVAEIQARPTRVSLVPELAARDSAIADYERVVVGLRAAFNRQQAANAQLRIALVRLRAAYDTIAPVLDSRPKPRGTWTPRVSADAGIDTGGSWDAGLRLQTDHVVVFAGFRDGGSYGRLGLSYPLF